MTRTIIRSDINETENKVTSGELYDSAVSNIPNLYTCIWIQYDKAINFINVFYNYRHQLTYNSRLIVIYARVTAYDMTIEQKRDPYKSDSLTVISYKDVKNDYMSNVLKVTKIHEYWCKQNRGATCNYHPVAALLTLKNDEIIPFDIAHLNDLAVMLSYDSPLFSNSFNIGGTFSIHACNIGSALFKIDYLYDPNRNIVNADKNSNTQIPITVVDFISANKPSLKHFIDESVKYTCYTMPILIDYINEHLREILSEQCPKEVLDLYDEKNKYIRTFTYISKRTLDRDAKLKRKAELEAELKQLENELI